MTGELAIFLLGCLVTVPTVTAVVLIGISEGRDPNHSGRHVDRVKGDVRVEAKETRRSSLTAR